MFSLVLFNDTEHQPLDSFVLFLPTSSVQLRVLMPLQSWKASLPRGNWMTVRDMQRALPNTCRILLSFTQRTQRRVRDWARQRPMDKMKMKMVGIKLYIKIGSSIKTKHQMQLEICLIFLLFYIMYYFILSKGQQKNLFMACNKYFI